MKFQGIENPKDVFGGILQRMYMQIAKYELGQSSKTIPFATNQLEIEQALNKGLQLLYGSAGATAIVNFKYRKGREADNNNSSSKVTKLQTTLENICHFTTTLVLPRHVFRVD